MTFRSWPTVSAIILTQRGLLFVGQFPLVLCSYIPGNVKRIVWHRCAYLCHWSEHFARSPIPSVTVRTVNSWQTFVTILAPWVKSMCHCLGLWVLCRLLYPIFTGTHTNTPLSHSTSTSARFLLAYMSENTCMQRQTVPDSATQTPPKETTDTEQKTWRSWKIKKWSYMMKPWTPHGWLFFFFCWNHKMRVQAQCKQMAHA